MTDEEYEEMLKCGYMTDEEVERMRREADEAWDELESEQK